MNSGDPPPPPIPFRKYSLSPLQRFCLVAKDLKVERQAAANTVTRLLERPDWSGLREHPDLRTCGALIHLGDRVTDNLNTDSRHAFAVAELAVAIAESLPDRTYPAVVMAQMRGMAWKDLGKSLRVQSRYDEALSAFATAQAAVAEFGALGHDLAVICFNVVVALQEMNRFDESLALVLECKKVFREHRDMDGLVRCGIAAPASG